MFRSASMQYTSPKQIVESINRSVCQSNDSYMFVTLFMGVLILAIVKLLGGKIWLDPDYTEGSRFIFDVPKK
jgi:sigma-B regulation protein RsbU (phosphoserine phosphatase)